MAAAAGEECVQQLAQIYGASIIRGRVEMLGDVGDLDMYDRIVPKIVLQ
jgi:hypothetical protein